MSYSLEHLALTYYLVTNLGDESFKKVNERMLEIAHDQANSYVEGVFEESS
jgi:hypothetical protein